VRGVEIARAGELAISFFFFYLLASCVLHFIHVLRLRRDCDFHFDSDLGLIDWIASID
jgi:hypothetical protein